jgi:hypothetical protein
LITRLEENVLTVDLRADGGRAGRDEPVRVVAILAEVEEVASPAEAAANVASAIEGAKGAT